MSVNTLIILDQSGSMVNFQKDVKAIYDQILAYCQKYSYLVQNVTTIGFSNFQPNRLFDVYDGIPKQLYRPSSRTPGEAFLLPMLEKLNSKPNEKWQVIFISDGQFDDPMKFTNVVKNITFPQFFPIFVSCGNKAAINQLMKAMVSYSYGRCSFLMENTTKLCEVMSDFHEQNIKCCDMESPFFFQETKMIYSDFPIWPNALENPKDVQIIADCIKVFSLCHLDNKLEIILSDLMRNRISYNRTLLINLAQKINTIDVTNSQKIVDAMQVTPTFQFNEKNVDDDVDDKSVNIFTWQRYKDENIYYRFIAYDNPNNSGAPIPYFWQGNSVAFETSDAKIYYNIEIMTINCKKFEPLVLTIRDETKNIKHYMLDRGQGIIDGGTGSRFVFDVNKSDFFNLEKMPDVDLEFQIDYKKNVQFAPKAKRQNSTFASKEPILFSNSQSLQDFGEESRSSRYSVADQPKNKLLKVQAKPIFANEKSHLLMGNLQMKITIKEDFISIKVFIVPSDNFMKFVEATIDTTGLFLEKNCVICLENPAVWYMNVCKHLVICDEDEKNYNQDSYHGKRCPKCRKDGFLIKAVSTTTITNEILPNKFKNEEM